MKQTIHPLVYTCLALCLMILSEACQSSVQPGEEAGRICTCLAPIDSLNRQLIRTLEEGNQDDAMEIMMDLNQHSQSVAACLEEGLPTNMTTWPSQEVREELDRQCPSWETMIQSLSGYPE